MINNPPERIELHPDHPSIIRVTHADGMQISYQSDGAGKLTPGSICASFTGDYTVKFFVPYGAGAVPQVLDVQARHATSHPGIRLRIRTPHGPLADQDSDALHHIAKFGHGASCDPACLPGCDRHGWVDVLPTPDLTIQVRAVDLPDSLPED